MTAFYSPGDWIECYPVQPPVLVVYSKSMPSAFQVIAFGFDIYSTPVKTPIDILNISPSARRKGEALAPTWLNMFKNAVLEHMKDAIGRIPINIDEVGTVLGQLCSTVYVAFRVSGTLGVRATVKPFAVSSSYSQLHQYISSLILRNFRSRTPRSSYTIAQSVTRFFFTPDQVSSYIFSALK